MALRTSEDEKEKGNENPLISDDPNKTILTNPTYTDRDPSDEALKRYGDEHTASASELADAERNPKDGKQGAVGALEEGLVKGGLSSLGGPVGSGLGALKTFFSGKKKSVSATIISIAFVFIGFFGWGIISGPLKIINFGQNLIANHLGDHEDASDSRLNRMYRFFKNNNDPGETRIGYLESKYKDRMISQLREIGLNPVFTDNFSIYEGFDVDTRNRNSPYYSLSEAELRTELNNRGYNVTDTVGNRDGNVRVYVSGTFSQKASLRLLIQELGYKGITSAIRSRPIQKYGLVSWNPLRKIDRKVNEGFGALYDRYKESRDKRRKGKIDGNRIDTTNAQEAAENPDGENTPLEGGEAGEPDPEKTKDILGQIRGSGTLKIAGGFAAASGIVCGMKQINDSWHAINFTQVFAPAIRVGMDLITIPQKIMAGELDAMTVGLASRELDEYNDKGKVVSTYSGAKTYKEDTGGKGGKDLEKEERDLFSQTPPAFISWTDDNALDPICSTAGQAVAGVIDVTLGVLSGGAATAVGGLAAGALLGDYVFDAIANLLAGDALNIDDASGARLANIASYGARAGGSVIAQQSGANILSGQEEKNLRSARIESDALELNEKGLAYKLFNPYDHRTLASKTIASMPSSMNLLPSLIDNTSNILGSILTSPFELFSNIVSAQTPGDGYDYPFPKYGFSLSELDDPLFKDPFENAEKAANILDSTGDKYIDRALDCYGIKIEKGPNGWDAQSEKTVSDSYDEDSYKDKKCDEQSTPWKRVRFFIFDTGVMTAWACFQDDEQACSTLGANASGGGGGDIGGGSIGQGVECPSNLSETKQVGSTTYYKMPEAQNGEYTFDPGAVDAQRYGHKELVCVIYTAAVKYKEKYGGRSTVKVGDLNASGHSSHNIGIAVDINAWGDIAAADTTHAGYNTQATIDFGKILVSTGKIKNIWWCPSDNSIEKIKEYAQSIGNPITIQCETGHHNHFHVDINSPPGDFDEP